MSTDQTLRTALMSSSKFDACQGLRVDDAWDRSDLVDDDLTEDIEILGLDFRDQVVLSEQGVELHDFLHFEELIVHFVLLRRSGANEHEPDGHPYVTARRNYCRNITLSELVFQVLVPPGRSWSLPH